MMTADSMGPEAWTTDPAAVLRWYVEAGVDGAVGEEPLDRFALSAVRLAQPPAARPRGPVAPPPAEPQADAQALARHASTLEALKAALHGFQSCPLRRTASTTVFADGEPASGVMIVGEAPGAEEDRLGLPFVGASGRLLDAMLASIGLDRRTCYITNVVPWRPPGNRKPTTDEVALCLPFLRRHIALVRPRVLLALGGLAAQSLLERTEGINRLRGQWMPYEAPDLPGPVPVLATFHPAYLLRTPGQKRLAWRDLLSFQDALDPKG
ncbi:uracil-DNA glycosylase [Pararhodospirillum photometricum]|nr:uracil-DNA glycosylase [Pararhodospirillum photometricum]